MYGGERLCSAFASSRSGISVGRFVFPSFGSGWGFGAEADVREVSERSDGCGMYTGVVMVGRGFILCFFVLTRVTLALAPVEIR